MKAQIATIDMRYSLKYKPGQAPEPKLISSSTSKKGKPKPIPKHPFEEVTDNEDNPFYSPLTSSSAGKKPKTTSTTKLTANIDKRIRTKKGTTYKIIRELRLY